MHRNPRETLPHLWDIQPSIVRSTVQGNNFEIKSAFIQMIQAHAQFGGFPRDDLNIHITNFPKICETFKNNRVLDDAIRVRLLLCLRIRQRIGWIHYHLVQSLHRTT